MAIQQDNSLGNLAGILGAIPGLSQAINGETTTSSTGISSSGMNYLLQQILSSTNGLASVASGQNTAGLYNSTVQTQMVNDLLTRSAGEVASKNATTTTTKQPTLSLGDTLLQGAAGLVGTKLLSKGIDSLGGTVADALGIGSGAAGGGVTAGGSLLSAITGTAAPQFSIAGGVPTAIANAALGGTLSSGAAAAGADAAISGVAGVAGDLAGAGAGLGGALGATGAGALSAGMASGLGMTGAIGAATDAGLAAGGVTLGGLSGAIAGDVAASSAAALGGGAAAGLGGAAAGGGLAEALAPVMAALAWVICTELETQGAMSHEIYTKAAPDFVSRMRLKPSAVRGYHYWAVRYTHIMRRKDWIGKFAVKIIKPLALGRARYISGDRNTLGWITFNILEPICSLLGNTIARKPQNWKSLYSQHKSTGE